MLGVLFTRDSKGEELLCGATSGSESRMFFSDFLGFEFMTVFKITFYMSLLE